jgi:hypothetical protein
MAKLERDSNNVPIGSGRKMFARALIWAGVALLVILVAAVFIARPAAKKIQPVTPNTPRSELPSWHSPVRV